MKEWPASGYSFTSWGTRARSRASGQLIGYALFPLGQAAIAADDGAGGVEKIIDIFWKRAAIVDAGGGEAVSRNEQEGESATHAEADDADASVAAGLSEEPASGGFDVVKGRAGASHHVANDMADADQAAALVIKVRGNGEETGLGEPVGLVAEVLAHAKDIVKNDDAGRGGRGCRSGEPGGHLAPRSRDEDVGHDRTPTPDGGLAADSRFYSPLDCGTVNC